MRTLTRNATFVCVIAVFVSVLALNGTVDAKVAPVRGAVCVQSGAKAREAVSGRRLVCVRTKTGVLRWRLQPKTTVAPKYEIGDLGPAGGKIFITPSTVGNSTGLYFEVAPQVTRKDSTRTWAPRKISGLSVGATSRGIGDGAANTAAIVSQASIWGMSADSSAAVYASEYSLNGFSDWFLPSRDELNEMYENKNRIGGYADELYWSSSEYVPVDIPGSVQGFNFAWQQPFRENYRPNVNWKDNLGSVRPVRSFTFTTRTTTPPTVAPKYLIGDVGPAGGTVFITPSSVGNLTGLYFEVVPFASEVFRHWASVANGNLSVPGARGTGIGDGATNTAAIARQVGNVAESSSAVYASEYSLNGFSDWFLPSKDELNEMYKNRRELDDFVSDWDTYHSSSEIDASGAWYQFFGSGAQGNGSKNYSNFTHLVRPVRAFP